jgi:hypothetical protein
MFGVLALSVIFGAALFAQASAPLTQADVDLYIKSSQTADPVEKANLITGAADPAAAAVNQGKIAAAAAMFAMGQTEDAIKTALNQNPVTAITDAELAVITEQKQAVVDAYNASVAAAMQQAK